jgi:hypothetical protein
VTSRLERDSNIASNDWPTSTCVKGLENSAQKLGLAPARRAEPKTPNSYERFPDHRRDRGLFLRCVARGPDSLMTYVFSLFWPINSLFSDSREYALSYGNHK